MKRKPKPKFEIGDRVVINDGTLDAGLKENIAEIGYRYKLKECGLCYKEDDLRPPTARERRGR